MFLMATMDNGDQIVSEFSKLAHVERYVAQVMAGGRPFNAWKVTSEVHPQSLDVCLIRTRQMISGRVIRLVEIVERAPTAPPDSLAPQDFVSVPMIQRGQYGTWKAPEENTPAGAVAGVEYPIKRDPATLVRYVTLKIANESTPELRFTIDAEPMVTNGGDPIANILNGHDASGPLDGDEDMF